jgi:glutathione synthase/RimK-type ligase-like ATP-grasp enzyme
MTKIAFATSDEWPKLTPSDQLAVKALGDLGIEAEAALWDDTAKDWTQVAAIVIRSTWDYHHRAEEFFAWLDGLEAKGVAVWNSPDIMRWNMDKTYLSDLEEDGVLVVPSVWLPKGAKVDLADIMRAKGWAKAVVKPTISAAADNTHSVDMAGIADGQAKLEDLLAQGGVIVQEFMAEIQTKGEWSLLFFDNQFSHAVLKLPKQDDFRVQWIYGGTSGRADAPAGLVAEAKELLEMMDERLLYARVDGVERDGKLVLMELELVEPHLFLEDDADAPGRFAKALAAILEAE